MTNEYHGEQIGTFEIIADYLAGLSSEARAALAGQIRPYLDFRKESGEFLSRCFSNICNRTCYESRLSACCSREGIITFFADLLVNVLVSEAGEIEALLERLRVPNTGFKCVYLGAEGCLWRLKPIVCEMFICDRAKAGVLDSADLRDEWEGLENRRKAFTWPDRPVLFDALEAQFIMAGYDSPLMYCHNSPGLLRIKKMNGVNSLKVIGDSGR